MERRAIITCVCNIEVRNANEYEALTEVDKMLEREQFLSDRATLIVKPDCISIDYTIDPSWIKERANGIPIQGGLNPKILLTDKEKWSWY